MLNSPKQVLNPKADEIDKAIDLLAAMGGKSKDVNALLAKMLEVQSYNDKVYADATFAKKEAEEVIKNSLKGQETLAEDKNSFEVHRRKELLALSEKYRTVEQHKDRLNRLVQEQNSSNIKVKEELAYIEKGLNTRVKDVSAREVSIHEQEKKSNGLMDKILRDSQKLDDTFSKLREILPK